MHTENSGSQSKNYHSLARGPGEGNGNPLQCSCLENPRDEGAWLAAVYGVAQSWTRLTRLSSSSRDELLCSVTFEKYFKLPERQFPPKQNRWFVDSVSYSM